jgi:hypothetical protein
VCNLYFDDSIFVIWNQKFIRCSWTGLSHVGGNLIQLDVLNGFVLNLEAHISLYDPCNLRPFRCHPNPSLYNPQGSVASGFREQLRPHWVPLVSKPTVELSVRHSA